MTTKNRPYVLIVDDDPQMVRLMKAALEEAGYEVNDATTGQKALNTIQQRRPDLLILDLNMPEPDGFDVLKIARGQFRYVRVLVISGYLTGALLDAAKFVGAIATLEKPFSPEGLVAKVRDVLGS